MRPWAMVALFAACSFTGRAQPDDAGVAGDGVPVVDVPPPPDDRGPCTTRTPYVDTCATPPPMGPLILDNGEYVLDSDAGTLVAPGGALVPVAHANVGAVHVITATDIAIADDATLYAIGARPLAIVATGTIDVAGAIDAGARGTTPGAGARTDCGTFAARPGTDDSGGAGGGGGGGFGADGGTGGRGDNNGGMAAGGLRGRGTAVVPTELAGGCPGGAGGIGDGDLGGAGGVGGGALLVIAQELAIATTGRIRAGGGGGRGGMFSNTATMDGDGGGGGGGSGGLVVLLVAGELVNQGSIVANGGGGGEGGCDCGAGNPGQDGRDLAIGALGGSLGATGGADGAMGGYLAMPAGATPLEFTAGAGGGGGGSVGFIVLEPGMLTQLGTVSPAAE